MKSELSFINKILRLFSRLFHSVWVVLFPVTYAKYYHKLTYSAQLNLNNPQDYNEKVQWLKLYSDTTMWTIAADKYKVRDYVSQCGLKQILTELYGVWDRPEDIDFNSLPNKFVLKTTNGCGKNILVHNKTKLDLLETKRVLKKWVKDRQGLISFQPHVWNIKRRIIAEELLEDNSANDFSSSLIDYKFFCFHGEPEIIDVLYDRNNYVIGNCNKDGASRKEMLYDLNWKIRPEFLSSPPSSDFQVVIPKPMCLPEMISICRILSEPFIQVRIDLYEVNGKVYFGELTFTPGEMNDFTNEYLLYLGSKIDLKRVDKRKTIFIV